MEFKNITIDNSKPQFNVVEWKEHFQKLGNILERIFESGNIPEDELQFRRAMMQKNFPIKLVSDKIMAVTGMDADDLDDEYPEREHKINAFLSMYEIIYPSTQQQPAQSVPKETNGNQQNDNTSEAEAMSLEEAQDYFEEHKSIVNQAPDGSLRFKAPLIYKDMPVTINSNFQVKCTIGSISRNNVLIIDNDSNAVVAIGRIVKKEDTDMIVISRQDINFEAFNNKTQFSLVVMIENAGALTGEMLKKPIKIQLLEMKKSDRVLCIDFGTSNTTAGSYRIKDEYGFEPELVEFADVTQDNRLVNYFPTVVYVEDCEDQEHIKYRFGFEAKALEREGNYESPASVFYQIKHWLIEDSYYPETIAVFDTKGNTFIIPKKNIVSAYIRHIIALSEDYFGIKFQELHFTAPVKIKKKFVSILKEILPEYTIIEDSIDEAGAILFDYVADKFSKFKSKTEDSRSEGCVAVIDCGGGTTDLATCDYRFFKDQSGQLDEIEMTTHFTNGDFNYGGNNITFRIMQLVKLKIAVKYGFISEEDLDKVLERSENDLLLDADHVEYSADALYSDFNALYASCEEFIPTQFNNMADVFFDDDKSKIKRNFYYLWQFADQVKIIFYREEKEVKKDKWDDAIQNIGDWNLNYLYRREDDTLVKIDNPFNLEITITEIRKVIFGDIYTLLNRILNLKNGLPDPVYDYYRLSGQSCKINLFNELLKEFIPGKRLRALMERSNEHLESITLKKHCIDGSIRYIMYKKLNMRTELKATYKPAERIYSVFFSDLMGDVPAEIRTDGLSQLKFYPVKDELNEVMLVIKDSQKVIRRLNLSTKKNEPLAGCSDPQEIVNILSNGNKTIDWNAACAKLADFKPLDGNSGNYVWITAVPASNCDGYGFFIYYIKKIIQGDKEEYRITKGKYYNYEETASGFFDGMR